MYTHYTFSPRLDENSYGYDLTLWNGDEVATTRIFRSRDDMYDYIQWLKENSHLPCGVTV